MTTGKTIALTRLTFVSKVRETNTTLSSNFTPLKKIIIYIYPVLGEIPCDPVIKNLPSKAGDMGSIPD